MIAATCSRVFWGFASQTSHNTMCSTNMNKQYLVEMIEFDEHIFQMG